MKQRYSLYKIYNQDDCPFNERDYSRFKFGDTLCAKKFAYELFEGFISLYREQILMQTEIILFPSPYYAIPTASNFLCAYFKEYLNYFLFENNRNACIEGKIHRNQTYFEDYGNMSFEERISLISNDTYYVDRHFIDGKFCLFLDDIKITGSHEKTVNRILEQYNVNGEFLFIYYAELVNNEIHPRIENHFNYFSIKEVNDIHQLMSCDSFRYNTRLIKYVLSMKRSDFESFLMHVPLYLQQELLSLAISNNYHQIERYQTNLIELKNKLWQLTYKKGKGKASLLQNLLLD